MGGAVAGRVSGGSWLVLATVIGCAGIDSGCGLWASQGGQRVYSSGDGRAGGRDGNPRGGGGDTPAAGAWLEPPTDRDGAGHLASHGEPIPGPGGVAAVKHSQSHRPARWPPGVAAATVRAAPRQRRGGAAGAVETEGDQGESADGGAGGAALAGGAAAERSGDGALRDPARKAVAG